MQFVLICFLPEHLTKLVLYLHVNSLNKIYLYLYFAHRWLIYCHVKWKKNLDKNQHNLRRICSYRSGNFISSIAMQLYLYWQLFVVFIVIKWAFLSVNYSI